MSTTHNKLFVDQVYADPSSITFSVKVKPTTYSEGCTSYPIEPSTTDEDLTSFFLKYPMTIDWGDDTISTFDGTKTITVSDFIHYYDTDVEDAEYTVHFYSDSGYLPAFGIKNSTDTSAYPTLHYARFSWTELLSAFPVTRDVATKYIVQNLYCTFYNFRFLTYVPSYFSDNYQQYPTYITQLDSTFAHCERITKIESGAFQYFKGVRTCKKTFYYCTKLNEIAADTFASMLDLTSVSNCFATNKSLTYIPPTLFKSQTKLNNFSYTFYTTSITEVPSEFLNHITVEDPYVSHMFESCEHLETVGTNILPPKTHSVAFLFKHCSLLKLNVNPFENLIFIDDWSSTFDGCGIETLPDGLFDKTPSHGADFSYTFQDCTKLKSAAGAFRNIQFGDSDSSTESEFNFKYTFYRCQSLVVSDDIFDDPENPDYENRFKNVDNINFNRTFMTVNYIGTSVGKSPQLYLYQYKDGLGTPSDSTSCFSGHSSNSLEDYDSIPEEWK